MKTNAVPSIFSYGKKKNPNGVEQKSGSWIVNEAVGMAVYSDICQVQTSHETDAGVQCAVDRSRTSMTIITSVFFVKY